jgi:hypothetical protein
VTKRQGFNQRLARTQVRIGNTAIQTSYGKREINVNTACGMLSPTTTSYSMQDFYCSPTISGRYLSLQSKANKWFNIAEVNIYTRGNSYYLQTAKCMHIIGSCEGAALAFHLSNSTCHYTYICGFLVRTPMF